MLMMVVSDETIPFFWLECQNWFFYSHALIPRNKKQIQENKRIWKINFVELHLRKWFRANDQFLLFYLYSLSNRLLCYFFCQLTQFLCMVFFIVSIKYLYFYDKTHVFLDVFFGLFVFVRFYTCIFWCIYRKKL